MVDIQKLGCMIAEIAAMEEANRAARDLKMQPPFPAEAFKKLPEAHGMK